MESPDHQHQNDRSTEHETSLATEVNHSEGPDDSVAAALLLVHDERFKIVPFLRLPQELLEVIFQILMRSDRLPLTTLHILTQVNCRLRDIIDNTPNLWTIVSLSDPAFLITRAMEYTKESSFEIKIHERRLPESLQPELYRRLAIVGPCRYRMHSIDLALPINAMGVELSRLFAATFPVLEHLSVVCSNSTPWGSPFFSTVIPPKAPLLRHVNLDGLNVPWLSAVLANLHSLRIRHIFEHPESTRALRLLRRNPALEDLELHSAATDDMWGDDPWTADEDEEPILLPFLKRLQIGALNAQLTCDLLANIQAPACTTFHLAVSDHIKSALHLALNFLPPRFLSQEEPIKLTMSILRDGFEVLLSSGDGEEPPVFFEVCWEERVTHEGLDWFKTDLLPRLYQPNFTLSFEPLVDGSIEDSRAFLIDVAPYISTLSFWPRSSIPWILLELGTREAEGYKFPKLQHLSFGAGCEMPEVLDMIRQRYGQAKPPLSGDVEEELPLPFKTLDVVPIRSLGQEEYGQWLSRFEAVVGSGVVALR